MRALTWIVLLGWLLGGTPVDAGLCKTKGGAVVVRDACRAREAAIDLAVAGPTGAPGAPGADGPPGSPPLRLVDAAGRLVGPAVFLQWYVQITAEGLPGTPLTYVLVRDDSLDQPMLLGIDYAGELAGTVYWTEAGCTGDAFVPGGNFIPVVEAIGGTLFVPGGSAVTTMIAAVERVNAANGCTSVTPRGGCCVTSPSTVVGALAVTPRSLDTLGIVPPLRAVAP